MFSSSKGLLVNSGANFKEDEEAGYLLKVGQIVIVR